MNNYLVLGCVGLLTVGEIAIRGIATPVLLAQNAPVNSTSAQDLIITPRVSGGVSSSGAGVAEFSHLEGFFPLFQSPGENLFFLEGQVSWLEYETLGANLLFGHRVYDEESENLLGGYIAYDTRDTGNNQFNQIGFGIERLGNDWDFRFNGYIPFGDTRKAVGSTTSTVSDVNISDLSFQGNVLSFGGTRTIEERQRYEAAMFTLDGEAGGKLLNIGDAGELRGYGGLYYLDATNTNALGWRARLEARALENYSVGLAVQHDEIFGTNVVVNFGFSFGGKAEGESDNEVLDRMSDSVARNETILVDEEIDINRVSETFSDITAINPSTGEVWTFQHVTSTGRQEGDGTFEDPFGVSEDAIATVDSTVNDIIYVQIGDNADLSGFTIPDNVQVLSTAVPQQINTQFGPTTLPLSGSGDFPTIAETVNLGNNTVLSGFNLTQGLVGQNINSSEVRHNTITSSTHSALQLENVTGPLTFIENTITGTNQPALTATNVENFSFRDGSLTSRNSASNGITLNNITGSFEISNSPITVESAAQNGLDVSNINQDLTLSNMTIENAGNNGINVSNMDGELTLNNITIDNATNNGINVSNITGTLTVIGGNNSQINSAGGHGMNLQNSTGTINISDFTLNAPLRLHNTTGTVNLTGNTVTTTNQPVLTADTVNNVSFTNGSLSSSNSSTDGISLNNITGNFDISNSQIAIDNASDHGIDINNLSGTLNLLSANNSQISNSGNYGINTQNSTGAITASGFTFLGGKRGIYAANVNNITLENNTITNVTESGIFVGVDNSNTLNSIVIQNNTLRDIGGGSSSTNNLYDGIFVGASGGSTISNITIAGNTVSNVDNDGIAIGATQSSTISTATITENTVSNVGRFGIGVGVDTPIDVLGIASSSGSTLANVAITNNSIDNGGVKTDATNANAGGNIGIAVEDTENGSNICVNVSGNTSTNPPSDVLGSPVTNSSLNNLHLYLQNAKTPTSPSFNSDIDPANFKLVQSSQLINNNNLINPNSPVQILIPSTSFLPPAPFFTPGLLGTTNSSNVNSCP
ncbi:right-handed parallel beta-helix repeat-containing protein [Spirulina sp. CS-785/01]|uniref:beta strand repeat-containing protein n=1 Tax=Spirulina sp. CS-785/01 TaxID=3021716 RepID=UPI00232C0B5F|nr:right-handed parallel beta-helix repeat-containing protein [Spirulina sp. CS-785/01]MDB9314179.1 right-handed parallel beta-helix repeat-containing protein [Spirulina sp. CS-785/01]